MKKRSIIALLALVALSLIVLGALLALAQDRTQGASSVEDPVVPGLGNTGYDVSHYNLTLAWNQETKFLDAVAEITMNSTQELSSFYLDLDGLEVLQASVDGDIVPFEQTGRELKISPESVIRNESEFVTKVAYSGTPATAVGIHPSGWNILEDSIYVLGEPRGASTWFPSNDHPTDKATMTVTVTVPQGETVAANGVLQGIVPAEPGFNTWVYESSEPLATYLATLVIGDYDIVTATSGAGVPIRNVFPADATLEQRSIFNQQDEMMQVFVELFGPYPFEVYGSVLLAEGPPAALETQTLSVFGPAATQEKIVAHELVHQWYGNSVTLSEFEDMWLNEGFATYGQLLWEEFGKDVLIEDAIRTELGSTQVNLTNPPGTPETTESGIFASTVYLRGALTLHALRLEIGDQTFFDLLKTWAEDNKYSNVTTEDFIEAAEVASGRALDDLFQTWLYEDGLPDTLGGIDLTRHQ